MDETQLEPISTVADLVAALGGDHEVAAIAGVGRTAVSNWKAWNRIPQRLHYTFFRACQDRGIAWEPPEKAA